MDFKERDIAHRKDFAKYFDHTLLRPEATPEDIETLCRQAYRYGCYSVCVNSRYVPLAARILRDLDDANTKEPDPAAVKITSVVGFPLGAMSRAAKIFEAENAIRAGAHDIDVVLPIGAVKAGNLFAVEHEIADIRRTIDEAFRAAHARKHGLYQPDDRPTLKVILETCLLSESEITLASKAAVRGGADYLKTSTGFGTGGALVRHLELMAEAAESARWELAAKQQVPVSQVPEVLLKASGGIRDLTTAKIMIEAGASRLGTSATVAILNEYYKEEETPL